MIEPITDKEIEVIRKTGQRKRLLGIYISTTVLMIVFLASTIYTLKWWCLALLGFLVIINIITKRK